MRNRSVMSAAAFNRTAFFDDRTTGAVYALPKRGLHCMCCAEPYTNRNLILDHTRLGRGRYLLAILCTSCNSRKQGRRWIQHGSFRWYVGMPCIPKRER